MIRNLVWSLLALAMLARFGTAQEAPAQKPILALDAGGHTAKIWKVLFTPDGKELISVSADRTIRIWDTATGEVVRVLRTPSSTGYAGSLFAAAVSPDGKRLAVGGNAPGPNVGVIYLIDLPSGAIERTFSGHKSFITSLDYASDGQRIASGCDDHTARIWNVTTGVCEQTLAGHTGPIYGLAFSPNGQLLGTGSNDKTGRLWSVQTGASEAVLDGHEGQVTCVAWNPNGKTVATGCFDAIRLWGSDGVRGKSIHKVGAVGRSLAFTSDAKSLFFSRGNLCSIMDVATAKGQATFSGNTGGIMSAALSPDGTLAATAGGNSHEITTVRLRFWETSVWFDKYRGS